MPRPRKWRRVCCLPGNSRFGPLGVHINTEDRIMMTIDEYETIRLIDLEGFTQAECAEQMQVSRTTVQGVYAAARRKLAELLVNGKLLWIEGGEYQVCDGKGRRCGRGCRRHHCIDNPEAAVWACNPRKNKHEEDDGND